LVPLCAAIGVAMVCHYACAQRPQIVRWDINATVTEIDDPLGLFPDIRLGDPVHGMLKYDVSMPVDSRYLSTVENAPYFDVTRMSIQNTRNGTERTFETDRNGDFADVNVFNDYEDENGPFDGIFAPQSVVAPPGFAGTAPVVDVFLQGPPTVFAMPPDPSSAGHLPSTLNLGDWPVAAMEFQDGWFSDPSHTYIQAEIYSLTPIIAPHLPGDYDYDGDVDIDDYDVWRISYGENSVLYADGNGNGKIDAADYVVWRANLGRTEAGASSIGNMVPESATALSLVVGTALGSCTRRRVT
jgi:hypothetical protein